jgi:hypothetical protein
MASLHSLLHPFLELGYFLHLKPMNGRSFCVIQPALEPLRLINHFHGRQDMDRCRHPVSRNGLKPPIPALEAVMNRSGAYMQSPNVFNLAHFASYHLFLGLASSQDQGYEIASSISHLEPAYPPHQTHQAAVPYIARSDPTLAVS